MEYTLYNLISYILMERRMPMDTAKLRGIIAERGYSQKDVARRLGMTDKTFYRKMRNGVFRTDEATKMVEFLHIDNPAAIF